MYKNDTVYKNGKEVDKRLAERSFYRLLFAALVLYVNQSGYIKLKQELESFPNAINDIMKKSVLNMLKSSLPFNFRK